MKFIMYIHVHVLTVCARVAMYHSSQQLLEDKHAVQYNVPLTSKQVSIRPSVQNFCIYTYYVLA